MSSSFSTPEVSASRQQPIRNFRCTEPGCGASYVRKEHLNRHSRQHQKQSQVFCEHCGHSFSRSDILRRHQKLYHDDVTVGRSRAVQACDYCHSRRTRCKGTSPCDTCLDRGIQCTFNRKDGARYQADVETDSSDTVQVPNQHTSAASTIDSLHPLQVEVSLEGNVHLWNILQQYERDYGRLQTTPIQGEVEMTDASEKRTARRQPPRFDGPVSELDVQRHVDVYFAKFHGQWPLLHRPSFRPETEPQFLVLSMVMISLWMSGDSTAQNAAVRIHERFVVLLQEQRDKWDTTQATLKNGNATWPMGIYQSILLHVIFATMRSNAEGKSGSSSLRLPLAIHELLESVLRSCLRLGVFHYPKMLEQYNHIDFAFLTWVRVEEVKRFALLLFRVWRLCYGIPLKGDPGVDYCPHFTLSDLRFPLPESKYLWEAEAIRELVSRRDKELRERSDVREEEQFWISNLGIDDLQSSKNWQDLLME